MTWCWEQNPRLRPSFAQVLESIEEEMSAAFRAVSFFHSPENKPRRGSGEAAASDTDTDQLLEEEGPGRALPPSSTPNGSCPLALGPSRDQSQLTNCYPSSGKPCL